MYTIVICNNDGDAKAYGIYGNKEEANESAALLYDREIERWKKAPTNDDPIDEEWTHRYDSSLGNGNIQFESGAWECLSVSELDVSGTATAIPAGTLLKNAGSNGIFKVLSKDGYKSFWLRTFLAVDIIFAEDGTVEWAYSKDGRFVSEEDERDFMGDVTYVYVSYNTEVIGYSRIETYSTRESARKRLMEDVQEENDIDPSDYRPMYDEVVSDDTVKLSINGGDDYRFYEVIKRRMDKKEELS